MIAYDLTYEVYLQSCDTIAKYFNMETYFFEKTYFKIYMEEKYNATVTFMYFFVGDKVYPGDTYAIIEFNNQRDITLFLLSI